MSNAYVIETGDEAVGIVIREGYRFRFLSSSRRFWSLEGRYYRRRRTSSALLRTVRSPRRGWSR